MTTYLKYLAALVLLSVVAACGQPAPDSASEAGAAGESAAESAPVMDKGVSSVDADGNVAPFGMASRKPVPVPEPAAAQPAAAQPAAAQTAAMSAESSADSSAVYGVHCAACHGADAKGVQGLGLNLVESQFVAGKSKAELIAFLKVGRQLGSPDNVSGVPMPAFAWMSDSDLGEVAGYLKSINN